RVMHYASQLLDKNPGFSHVGTYLVYRDQETGIEQVLIADNYPYATYVPTDNDKEDLKQGGARIVGREHFSKPAHYSREGVTKYNMRDLYKQAQNNLKIVQKEGWDAFVKSTCW